MPTVSRTFTVTPPPHAVLHYLRDFGNAEQWDPGTQHCERIDDGPVAEGSSWRNVSKIFGVTTELTYTLTELSDRKLVFVGENKSAVSVDTITVDAAGSGSVVSYVAELDMRGAATLLTPVMKLVFEKLARDTEQQLTTVLNELVTS